MDWIPSHVSAGGPWALLVSVVLGICFLLWRGNLVPSNHVDRTIAGYRDNLAERNREIDYLRAANAKLTEANDKLADQNRQLMAHSAVSTHALEDILREAKRRELGE